jgi:hypothetical protein
MRRFRLVRDEDVSGVSGTGVVAIGVQLPTGRMVMEWLGRYHSIAIYASREELDEIHSHEGRTRIEWIDGGMMSIVPGEKTNAA